MKKYNTTVAFRYAVVLFELAFLFYGSAAFASEKLRVICTFFPLYLFTKNVVGDQIGVSVELLLPPDMGCPHDYSLTPGDIKRVSRADMVVVNGLGVDGFLSSSEWSSKGGVVVVASSGAEAIRTPVSDSDAMGHHDGLLNPHLFASPAKAIVYTRNIEKALSSADLSRNYKDNARRFILRLEGLVRELAAVTDGVSNKRVILFHDSLEYLLNDAKLEVVGVVHAADHLSVREVVRLIRKINRSSPAAIFSDSQYPSKMVNMISRETKVPHFSLDSVAGGAGYEPGYYEAVMRKNIDTIKKALSD